MPSTWNSRRSADRQKEAQGLHATAGQAAQDHVRQRVAAPPTAAASPYGFDDA